MFAALGLKLATWAGKSVLMQSPIGGLLKKVPSRVWKIILLVLAAALIIFLVLRWHSGKVETLRKESYAAGWNAAVEAGKQSVRQVENSGNAISKEIRSKTDEATARSNRHANDLSLRGPGRAICPSPSASTGGHEPRGGTTTAGVDRLPDTERQQLIGVPFQELVNRAATADANRIEVLSWREFYARLVDEYEKARAKADQAGTK